MPRAKHAEPKLRHPRTRWLAVAATAAVATTWFAGPANAHVGVSSPVINPVAGPQVDLGISTDVDTMATFDHLLRSTRALAREQREAREQRHRERVHERQVARQKAHAKERARRAAAAVRASRAALRSTVVRPISSGYRVTARFGESSSRWGSGHHTGLDFACASGTPVRVVATGVVVRAGYEGSYGNRIEVRHADGTVTSYSHLSRIGVRGGAVSAGQIIGRVGATGNVTGAHLHFEVFRGGSPIDPSNWLAARHVAF